MPLEPQDMPIYPPCPRCGSTTACPCPGLGPDAPLDQRSERNTVTIATVYPGARKADWERSVAVWHQQAQDEQDERHRLIAEREYEKRKKSKF
jgi:hypothetical protein